MLIIDHGYPQLDVHSLLQPPPADFDGIIARYKDFDATLFYHFVSSPDCRYEKNYGVGRIPAGTAAMGSKDRFKNILKSQKIIGNPKGFFVNKSSPTTTPSELDDIKSVSFALAKHEKVKQHFEARGSRYAIVFNHEFLEKNGIRPVVYLNDNSADELKRILFAAPHLLEVANHKYDMRWENEWRIRKQLSFQNEDVAFLIVPDEDYQEMYEWMSNALNQPNGYVDDYLMMPASLFDDPIAYLGMVTHLQHEYWSKVSICESYSFNLDEFLDCTESEREVLIADVGVELNCMAKAVVQQLYEYKYVERFLKFSKDVRIKSIEDILKVNLRTIAANCNQPTECVRDLLICLFRKLFDVQKTRLFAAEIAPIEDNS